ncbi:MAG TPA: molybdopterin synthase catalytic subunit MoaE [Spongiibacteraceae bacterium]|jgi:molybdopterin synthase catalytic subunit|nr:molybdopterin synthase catalytic subunit MoaE [Spongiibacteraceae bacterium]HUH37944.1 molybdopterin synthase catalytic subunit MoaE [Spongiibacteraceae bacterium]
MISVAVQEADFDAGAELRALQADNPALGAVASFVGLMRDRNEGVAVTAMALEHYPGMTEASIRDIAEQACERWPLGGVRVVHRVGLIRPGEQIVLVAVSAAHRKEAFAGCEFIMDYLKTRAPFWKKETTAQGEERWVQARDTDQAAAARW